MGAYKKFTEKEFLKTLKKLNKIPYLNHGGCAIAAYALTTHLRERYDIGSKIHYLMDEYDGHRAKSLKRGMPRSCGHAVVRVKGKLYDSNGLYCIEESCFEYTLKVKKPLVLQSIRKCTWNDTFSRVSQVPKIAAVLGIDLQI